MFIGQLFIIPRKYLFVSCTHFVERLYIFLLSYEWFLYIQDTGLLSGIIFANAFSQSKDCHFISLVISLKAQKFLMWMPNLYVFFFFSSFAFGCFSFFGCFSYLRNFLTKYHEDCFEFFFQKLYKFSCCIMFMIHFQ